MVSRKSKTATTHIPRPSNMYMLFRKSRQAEIVAESTDPTAPPQQDLSKRIGREWNALSPEDRRHWEAEAEKEKREHERLYPNYKFAPKSQEDKEADRVLRAEEMKNKRAAAAAAKEAKKRSPRARTTKSGRARKTKALSAAASASSSSLASTSSSATVSSTSSSATVSSTSSADIASWSPTGVATEQWSFVGISSMPTIPFTSSPSTAPSTALATPSPVVHQAIDLMTSGLMPYTTQSPALLHGAKFPASVMGNVHERQGNVHERQGNVLGWQVNVHGWPSTTHHTQGTAYDTQGTAYDTQDTTFSQTMTMLGMQTTNTNSVHAQDYGYMDPATAAMYADITGNKYNGQVDFAGQAAYNASRNGISNEDSLFGGQATDVGNPSIAVSGNPSLTDSGNPISGSPSIPISDDSYSYSGQNDSWFNASSRDATQPWNHYLTPEDIASSSYDVTLRYPASLSRTTSYGSSSSMGFSAPNTSMGYSAPNTSMSFSAPTNYENSTSSTLPSQPSASHDLASDAGAQASTNFDWSSSASHAPLNAGGDFNSALFGDMALNSDFDAITGAKGGIDYSELFVNSYAPSVVEGEDALV